MGHFTVPCGLSGIAISHRDPIIGFNVELASYNHTYSAFVPTNMPVFGYYDDYGRLEDKEGNILRSSDRGSDEDQLVLCHKALWDIASSGFDKVRKDYRGEKNISIMEYFTRAKARVKRKNEILNADRKTIDPKVITEILRELAIGGPEDREHGFHRTLKELWGKSNSMKFSEAWNERLENGPDLTQEEADLLSQMCLVYVNSYTSGRQLTTTRHCWTIQDTDYKAEAKWHAEVAKFAKSKTKRRK